MPTFIFKHCTLLDFERENSIFFVFIICIFKTRNNTNDIREAEKTLIKLVTETSKLNNEAKNQYCVFGKWNFSLFFIFLLFLHTLRSDYIIRIWVFFS